MGFGLAFEVALTELRVFGMPLNADVIVKAGILEPRPLLVRRADLDLGCFGKCEDAQWTLLTASSMSFSTC
jgi:hypothetical protein